jgi:hypothetical protein
MRLCHITSRRFELDDVDRTVVNFALIRDWLLRVWLLNSSITAAPIARAEGWPRHELHMLSTPAREVMKRWFHDRMLITLTGGRIGCVRRLFCGFHGLLFADG